VEELARSVRAAFAADLGLAVGPLPLVEREAAQVPPYYIALATPETTVSKGIPLATHPDLYKLKAAKDALNLARLWLMENKK
jgi:hypothetical protein